MAQHQHATSGPVLFITDLSARCDRAMDRASQIAKSLNTKLIALHVTQTSLLEKIATPAWRKHADDHRTAAEYQLKSDLAHVDVPVEIIIEHGDPVERILSTAKHHHCSMIVSGTASDETLGRVVFGNTVEKLARQCELPLLIVRKRVFHAYKHVVVATDFSSGSRHALEAAVHLLPQASLTLFHAFEREASSQWQQNTAEIQHADTNRAAQFLQDTPALKGHAQPKIVTLEGAPHIELGKYVDEHNIEIAVLGTHGLTGILRTAIGSVAEKLLATLPCDVMIVRQAHSED